MSDDAGMEEASLLRAGYRLDRYELLCPIASGGMASVWLARLRGKRGFEKLFAIKTIKTELTDDARFQEMFLDEARIASGIEHPNVAHIIDLGEQDNILYLVMEWVDGDSLAKVARIAQKKGTPLPLGVALRIIADACAGLHAAHELKDAKGQSLGVVHRDVSPQNILVTPGGAVKVIDFGVAKARNRRAGETGEGVVKGKIRFMAPEQVKSKGVDRRADLWALGVCLYQLVTGKLPYEEGDSDIDIVQKLLGDAPPTIDTSGMPEAVREILAHTLVRDTEERFATAAAMRRALENAMTKLDSESTSEEVADFVRLTLPELAEKRGETLARAIQDAELRESGGAPSSRALTSQAVQAAFAPTVIEEVKSGGKLPAKLLTTKELFEQEEESKLTPAGLETSATTRAGKSFVWLAMLGAVAAGAWFVWPGAARIRALRSTVVASPVAAAATQPSTSSSPSVLPSASGSPTPIVIASTAPSASVSALEPRRPTPALKGASAPSASAPAMTVIAAPSATEAPTDEPY